MQRIYALIGFITLFTQLASAGLVPLNNGTWTDSQFAADPAFLIAPATGVTDPFAATQFPIDSTSTAVYDTATGKITGQLKLLGGLIGFNGPITNLVLDFSKNDGTIWVTVDQDGIPLAPASVYALPTLQATSSHLTGTGHYVSSESALYQLDVDGDFSADPAPVPLPAAVWMGLTGLAGAAFASYRRRHKAA